MRLWDLTRDESGYPWRVARSDGDRRRDDAPVGIGPVRLSIYDNGVVTMRHHGRTGRPISTGIETDEHSLKQIDDIPARTRCPFCGLDHTWWKREAWLADQPQQPLLQSSEGRTLDKTA